jgi:importin subunit alpha-6/7
LADVGDDVHTQHVLDHGVIAPISVLLDHSKTSIRKEAMWTFSNITAGTLPQIQMVVEANVFPKFCEKIFNDEFAVRKEAIWAVSNATSGGDANVVQYLVNIGAVRALIKALDESDARVVTVALEGLENMLRFGERAPLNTSGNASGNPVLAAITAVDEAVEKIEALQNHDNHGVYAKATALIEKYFGAAEDPTL